RILGALSGIVLNLMIRPAHRCGFWILECADLEEALAWARKGAISCDAAGEGRGPLFFPLPNKDPAEANKKTCQFAPRTGWRRPASRFAKGLLNARTPVRSARSANASWMAPGVRRSTSPSSSAPESRHGTRWICGWM